MAPHEGRAPIIFVTGIDNDPARILRAYEGGAVDIIQKPFVPEIIRSKVSVFVALFRAKERLAMEQRSATRALKAMSDLALALADARTPAQVAVVVVEQGSRVAHADTCSLYALDEGGSTLELIGHRGVAPEIIEQTRRLTENTAPMTFAALRSGESTWAETAADYARIHPGLARTKAQGSRAHAFWSVPLIAEGRAIGLLGMGFYEERRFPPAERSMVETLAKQCAQALLRAARLEREEQARARLATTLQSIGDAVIATDTAGRVTLMNAVAERLTGWGEREARGRPLAEVFVIFSEETRAPSESPVARVLREGTVVGLANHTLLRSRSGVEIAIDDTAAPIRDGGGNLFGVVLVFRDATVEKREKVRRDFLARAGAALASSLDYRATLTTVAQLAVPQLADWCAIDLRDPGAREPSQVAVAHVDPNKVRWVREFNERYPPDPDAATGAPQVIRSGKSELYPEIPRRMLEEAARDEEHLVAIRELRLKSAMVVPLRGRETIFGAMTFVFAEDSGRSYTQDDLAFAEEFARRAAMAIDNARALKEADEARAEERLLRREADIANRAKDEFLATVSHELRTPLNAILGWTVTLRGRAMPADVDHALAIIERNARRQTRLIEDVLDMSRIISGKLSLTMGPTDIAAVIQGALEAVQPAADAKGLAIQVDADPSLTITADSDRLQQVVWNLLANAVKFSQPQGRIWVQAYREGPSVAVRVADSGEGIATEALPHVFEPFRQADASTTRRHGGLGLGLAIVKQLVIGHGGTVSATSDGVGHGATFIVTLPARTIVEAASTPATTATSPPTAADSLIAPRLDGLTVLVVDDEEDARVIVERVLRDQGAQVITASSAVEALEAFEGVKPDVIVSDVGMPGMDGYALLRQVRTLPSNRGGRTPAVALTAYARREDAHRAFAAGFQMHATKPIDPAQLATMVGNLGGRTL
jgi:PAS domain S-box-containing protein